MGGAEVAVGPVEEATVGAVRETEAEVGAVGGAEAA